MIELNKTILLKSEVKTRLRYRSDSAFYDFLKDESNGFPLPFKIGGRNCWYRGEVEAWIGDRDKHRGIESYDEERKAKMRG